VLLLVGDQHLVDEAVAELGNAGVLEVDLVEDLERALADLAHVGPQLRAAEDRKLVPARARVLDRVVETAEVPVERLAAARALDEP
jgi:hypothetical protein